MKAKVIDLIRWAVALALGGFGIYMLVEMLPAVTKSDGSFFSLFTMVFMFCLLVAIPLLMARCMIRRRYYELCSVLAMLGAMVVFFVLLGLPGWFHRHAFRADSLGDSPFLASLGVLLSFVFLIAPFIAAPWFYRFCMQLVVRYVPPGACRTWPAAEPESEGSSQTTRK